MGSRETIGNYDQAEKQKQAAARAALRFVHSGMKLGLGSGSTAQYFIGFLGERVKAGELTIEAVPSSLYSAASAKAAGIPLVSLSRGALLDLTVDGADEIAPDLALIKGAGGALLREKVLVHAARHFLVIADASKSVWQLGGVPVPVEVVPFAVAWVADQIAVLGAEPILRMDRSAPGEKPFLTDQENVILDCHFGEIADPRSLAARLESIPGVAAHGIFLDCTTAALVAGPDGVVALRSGRPSCAASEFELPL